MTTTQPAPDEPMWGTPAIARFLSVNELKIKMLAEKHRLPAYDIDGELRVHRSDLMAWLESRKVAQR